MRTNQITGITDSVSLSLFQLFKLQTLKNVHMLANQITGITNTFSVVLFFKNYREW